MIALLLMLATAGSPSDELGHGMTRWRVEGEPGARVTINAGVMDIDTPAGVTIWLRKPLTGPVAIDYDVKPVRAGGANDAVSDVNAFWMATDATRRRDGAFASYDDLRTYYVGVGGNRNTTTRFRRYVGKSGNRPLLPQHDRGDRAALLTPNVWTHVRLIADGRHVAVERDGATLFTLDDEAPYRRGHFGLRTTKSHLLVRHVRVTPLGRE